MVRNGTSRTSGYARVLAAALVLASVAILTSPAKAKSDQDTSTVKPRLTVIMFVDQMRADYLTRWTSLYKGGLRRLATHGAVFTNAWQDHAITQTAVGHATVATGTIPARHGIVSNSYYDRHAGTEVSATTDSETMLIGGSGGMGSSSRRLLRPALGDWIKTQSTGCKVFAASLKERAAVLTGGLAPDGVFWYDDATGSFVSSSYYLSALPAWVSQFNESGAKETWRDSMWSKTDSSLMYQGDDGVLVEFDGVRNSFPHALQDMLEPPDSSYYRAVYETPFGDALLLKFCSEIILHEQLGEDAIPDILFISLSAADRIGHTFGPDSHEIQDYFLRLDKYLTPLFKMLDANVGRGQYLFVLTADHGVCPLPEIEVARGNTNARRVRTDEYAADVRMAVSRAFSNCVQPDSLVAFVGVNIRLNEQYLKACSLSMPSTRHRVASAVQNISYVSDVFTYDQLAGDELDGRPFVNQFRNCFHKDRSPDLMVNFMEWILVTGSAFGTGHGTPYHYDSNVPMVYYGGNIKPEIYGEPVRTVDIAPTVTELMGFSAPDDLDGQVIRGLR